jgi:hypothetical protein
VPPSEVQLDLRMGTLWEEIVKWAKESFHSLMGRQDMVRKGWKVWIVACVRPRVPEGGFEVGC